MQLPIPEGRQKEVLALPEQGHYVVLGTAGSGKTTLAIHRAIFLANKIKNKTKQKVLLITFNKTLVTYINSISYGALKNIDVRNYHWFAKGYLSARNLMDYGVIVPNNSKKLSYIKLAIVKLIDEIGNNSTLSRAPEVFYEELCWIQKKGIVSLEKYLEAKRVGRGDTRITRDKRKIFFKVYEIYLQIREIYGYKYDWDDLAQTVISQLKTDSDERMYKHVIIDEGQDLSPIMLQSLALSIPTDGSITFFGDVAQQIYGDRISWREAGLEVPSKNIWKFDQNYRNSKEIADLAISISQQPFFKQSADLVVPKQPVASGPKPLLVEFKEERNELNWVVDSAQKLSEKQSVAILVRTRQTTNQIERILNRKKINYQKLDKELSNWDSNPGISVGTYHSAKGLEFDAVFIPYCSMLRIPSDDKIIALENRQEALSDDAKLVYVAITRAKRTLVISYSGVIAEVIPLNDNLYKKINNF